MEPITTATVLAGYYTFKELANVGKEIKDATPKIADNAKNLWRKVSGKSLPSSSNSAEAESAVDLTTDEPPSGTVQGVSVDDLQNQMRASLEVTNALAEQSVRFADFVEATRQQFEAIEKQNCQLIERVESDRLALKALENQSSLLFQRIESDSALMKSLEAQNLKLARDVELAQARIGRLTGICMAIGLLAIAGLAIAIGR